MDVHVDFQALDYSRYCAHALKAMNDGKRLVSLQPPNISNCFRKDPSFLSSGLLSWLPLQITSGL